MKEPDPALVPDEPLSRDEMVALQHEIAERAVFEDEFGKVETIAGVDQAFTRDGDVAVSAAVALQEGETVETATAKRETHVPYIPGFLAFREGEAVVASLEKLDMTPDIVLVDGSGRIHPRQAGLATHVGVALDVPTVGVAKSLLCGTPRLSAERHEAEASTARRRVDERLEEGECVPVVADEGVEIEDGTVIGYAYQSKQYAEDASTTVNPLYVSPGHRVSAEKAVDFVAETCEGYKLPEPVRRADALADEAKDRCLN